MLNKIPMAHTTSHYSDESEQFPAEQSVIVTVNIIG